jgi:hypothetical protein
MTLAAAPTVRQSGMNQRLIEITSHADRSTGGWERPGSAVRGS